MRRARLRNGRLACRFTKEHTGHSWLARRDAELWLGSWWANYRASLPVYSCGKRYE